MSPKPGGLSKRLDFHWPTRHDPQPPRCRLYTIHNVSGVEVAQKCVRRIPCTVPCRSVQRSHRKKLLPATLIATTCSPIWNWGSIFFLGRDLAFVGAESPWRCWKCKPLLMNRVKPEKFPNHWSKTGNIIKSNCVPAHTNTPHHGEFPSTSSIAGLLLLETEARQQWLQKHPIFLRLFSLGSSPSCIGPQTNRLMLPWGVLSSRSDSPPLGTSAPAPPAGQAPRPQGCARVHWRCCGHWLRAALGGCKPERWEGWLQDVPIHM